MSSRPLLLAALAALVALAPVAAQPAGRDLHVVQAGETLFRIARANGLSVDRLRELNALPSDAIQVGQTLRLSTRVALPARPAPPAAPPTTPTAGPAPTPSRPPAAATGTVHTVAAGETLFRIAQRHRTTVEVLRRLNGLPDDRIEIGQRLVVSGSPGAASTAPTSSPAPATSATLPPIAIQTAPRRAWSITDTTIPADLVHFVDPGETLYSIASAHRVSVNELAAANALTTAPLQPGTPLYLPRAVEPAVVARRGMPPPDADGLALVYPDVMRGRPTASGEPYDPLAYTASHRTYPLGTVLLVTNPLSNRSTFVRVIDRGPVSQSYLLELSAAAATALELDPSVARRVDVRLLP